MSVDVPVTIWRPTDGNSEMGQSDNGNIVTLSGVLITVLNGSQLVIDSGTSTPVPATIWEQDDSI